MSNTVSLKRIYLLLRTQLPGTRIAMLALLLTPFILLVLHGHRVHPYVEDQELIQRMFAALLVGGGCIFASMAFYEMQDKRENFAWFMLPASMLEKFLAHLLLSTVLYIVFLLTGFYLVTLAADLAAQYLFGNKLPLFQPFDTRLEILIGRYLFLHSIFFLGAAWFRKRVFIKMLLAVFVLFILLVLLIGFMGYWVYPELRVSAASIGISFDWNIYPQYRNIARWIVYVFVPLLLWFLTYLRVRKTQISYGI